MTGSRRLFIIERGGFRPYGKFLIGRSNIQYPFAIGNANYFALAPGAGTEYRLSHRWIIRAEYEYQLWLNSPGYFNEPNHQLNPNGLQVGVSFKLLP